MEAIINFKEMHQAQQIINNKNGDCMVSLIVFDLVFPESVHENLSATIKQTAGSKFNDNMIEVSGPPVEYKGPFNYQEFADAARIYYKKCISFVGVNPDIDVLGAFNMSSNLFQTAMSIKINIDSKDAGW